MNDKDRNIDAMNSNKEERVRVKLISADTLQELEDRINEFLDTMKVPYYLDCKIGKGDFHTAMVIYVTKKCPRDIL